MSENKCCTIEVNETEKGVTIQLTGSRIKDCLAALASCCKPRKK